jgi:hypothetical protein
MNNRTMILNNNVCWAVFTRLPLQKIQRIIKEEWRHEFPYGIDPPPWEAFAGSKDYSALISRLPGSEGSDRDFAEAFSRLAKEHIVYSIWLHPERECIFEWKNGKELPSYVADPLVLAEALGFQVARQPEWPSCFSLTVVEGATVEQVKLALGEIASEPWITIRPNRVGVLITADDKRIGTQAWDVSEKLTTIAVYYVQQCPDEGRFMATVIRDGVAAGTLSYPAFEDDTISDIMGYNTPNEILQALHIPPEELGL